VSDRSDLRELCLLFLRLGATTFGGPAAHIAMMQNEVVRRRQWLTEQEFLDLLSAANLVPGPNSTELAIHIGRKRAGWPGLVAAGVCFIAPAMLIVGLLAWFYVSFGSRPQAEAVLYGVKPAIIAVVFQALYSLSRTAVKTPALAALGIAGSGAVLVGINELIVLLGSGILWILTRRRSRPAGLVCAAVPAGAAPALFLQSASGVAASPVGLLPLFLFFAKVGSVLFGSGYVLLAFLRADLVERWHWMTEAQLLDAIAIGQVTPGPVFTTATFIGYLLAGGAGAAVATFGIFLPAFVFVAISGPLVPRLRNSPSASAFLDGVNVASLALMTVVTWHLSRSALIDATTLCIAVVSAVALLRFHSNSAWLVLGGAAVGLLTYAHIA
jgi:chromate transporter